MNVKNPRLRLGILAWRRGRYFEERRYFTDLAREAELEGIEVSLFSPSDVLAGGKIQGLIWRRESGWTPSTFAKPDLVYDRFRNMSKEPFREFVKFRKGSDMKFLNMRLAHKWNIHRILMSHPTIARWLPETSLLTDPGQVMPLLSRYGCVYIKPVNGTGGKGILSVHQGRKKTLQIRGRSPKKKIIKTELTSPHSLKAFIRKWTQNSKYIIQQGLDLEWINGLTTDFRLLVQKDGQGNWSITGLGGKIGSKDSATSNLHGGGKAVRPELLLQNLLPAERLSEIFKECEEIGILTAKHLEEHFGNYVEFGIDLGIDRNGRVWIIEVNSKPGRDIFRLMGDYDAYRTAVRRPLEYARFVRESAGG